MHQRTDDFLRASPAPARHLLRLLRSERRRDPDRDRLRGLDDDLRGHRLGNAGAQGTSLAPTIALYALLRVASRPPIPILQRKIGPFAALIRFQFGTF